LASEKSKTERTHARVNGQAGKKDAAHKQDLSAPGRRKGRNFSAERHKPNLGAAKKHIVLRGGYVEGTPLGGAEGHVTLVKKRENSLGGARKAAIFTEVTKKPRRYHHTEKKFEGKGFNNVKRGGV